MTDDRVSIEILERPTRDAAAIYGNVNWAKEKDKRECRALSIWSSSCSRQADLHASKAKSLRKLNVAMISTVLCLTGSTAVLSGLATDEEFHKGPLAIGALVLSSLAGVAAGISAFVDAAGRRNLHLLSESSYSILSRDIAVYLLSTDDPEQGHMLNSEMAIQAYQRRLDNLETSSPPL